MAEATKQLVREYETIYLMKAEVPDDQVDEVKERLRTMVTREGGKVIRFTNQGKRKTAFLVAKNQRAHFMHCLYLGKPGIVTEFERNLKMIDTITKFQSVKLADDVDMASRNVEEDLKLNPVEEEARIEARPEMDEFDNDDFRGED
jgi:small subunit ribosomal protein S6